MPIQHRANRLQNRRSSIESLENRSMLAGDGIPVVDVPLDPPFDVPVEEPGFTEPAEPGEPNPGIVELFEGDSDAFGDTPDTAVILQADGVAVPFGIAIGRINSPTDKDVFQLDPGAAFLEVHPETPGLALHVTLQDRDGNILAESQSDIPGDDVPGAISPVYMEIDTSLTDSPYFIVVESLGETEGEYVLQFNLDGFDVGGGWHPDSELGDDIHSGSVDQTATELSLEEDYAYVFSNIDRDADSDVFRFTATRENVFVDAFGELPIVLQVYDGEGNVIPAAVVHLFDDPAIPEEEHPELPAVAEFSTVPGEEYFVSVGSTKGRVGAYELSIHTWDPPEPVLPDAELGNDIHGETFDSSTRLEMEHGHAEVFSNIDSENDVDVFRFAMEAGAEEGSQFVHIDAFGEKQIRVRLFDGEGELVPVESLFFGPDFGPEPDFGPDFEPELEPDFVPPGIDPELDIDGDGRLDGMPHGLPLAYFAELPNGVYFLEVSGAEGVNATGSYNLNILADFVPVEPGFPVDPVFPVDPMPFEWDAEPGNDIHGDTLETATPLPTIDGLLASAYSNIDTETDVDVFSVVANGPEIYFDIGSQSEGFVFDIEILDADGGEVELDLNKFGIDGDFAGEGHVAFAEGILYSDPGATYFFAVSGDGNVGSYWMNVFDPPEIDVPGSDADSEQGEDIHGNDFDSATKIFANHEDSYVHSWIDATGDVDVFGFVATGDIVYIEANSLNPEMFIKVEVVNEAGELVPSSHNTDDEFHESLGGEAELEVGQKYFVRISAAEDDAGEYALHIFQPLIDIDPVEPVEPVDPINPIEPDPWVVADSELGHDIHGEDFDSATLVDLSAEGWIEVSSNIDHEGDVDAFQFVGTGDLIVAEVGGFGSTEMVFEVVAANGTQVAMATAWGALEIPSVADEVYYLRAHSDGADPGQYVVVMQSLVGVDPGRPIGPVDPVEPVDPAEPVDPESPETSDGDVEKTDDELRVATSDINEDGEVGFGDFLILSENFGKEVDAAFADGDLNGDGVVDMADFLMLSEDFGLQA